MKQLILLLKAIAFLLILFNQSVAFATDWKKQYCNNNAYIAIDGTNIGSKYPHLHCDKNFFTYSPGKNSNRYNMNKGDIFLVAAANNACKNARNNGASLLKSIIRYACSKEKGNGACESCK